MEKQELETNLNSIKDEYKKLANFDLGMIFLLCLILWSSLLELVWLSFGMLMLLTGFIYLRYNYMKKLFYRK